MGWFRRGSNAGELRLLRQADRDVALALCAEDPATNLFVASRISRGGVEKFQLGCEMWGYFVDGDLDSLFHVGGNLVPVAASDDAIAAFVDQCGRYRGSNAIMGPSEQVLALYEALAHHNERGWGRPRDVRCCQPLLACEGEPRVASDPRVRPTTEADYEAYFAAAVRMYTEEVGVSPLTGDDSYARHVRRTIAEGKAFAIADDSRVWFKADVGAALGRYCQVQGVWLDPELRGQGLSGPAMAAVVEHVRLRWPVVTLYVNDYNAPAMALYDRIGFETIGTYATVLY